MLCKNVRVVQLSWRKKYFCYPKRILCDQHKTGNDNVDPVCQSQEVSIDNVMAKARLVVKCHVEGTWRLHYYYFCLNFSFFTLLFSVNNNNIKNIKPLWYKEYIRHYPFDHNNKLAPHFPYNNWWILVNKFLLCCNVPCLGKLDCNMAFCFKHWGWMDLVACLSY